jgi:outer membrane biosynthesis protein TonB
MRTFVLALAIAGCWRSSDPPPAKPAPAPAPTGGAGYGGTGYAQLTGTSNLGDPLTVQPGQPLGTIAASSGPYGSIGSASRNPAVPNVSAGNPTSHGDLDKAEIRRAIKQHMSAIIACYEKALPSSPGIAGRMLVQFFIERDGSVSHSSASGIDPIVDACVADVIKGIKFSPPKGGGGVQVNYPFNFQPAGGP